MCLPDPATIMNGIKALIVDDSPFMRKFVEHTLRQAGIELTSVYEAGNGDEALAVIEKESVQLILCDIDMPGMGGIEFIKAAKSANNAKGVPIVMVTAQGSESLVVQALSLGAAGYLRKPFAPDQVRKSILPLLGLKS
jgi:two-component system, chemotaxis family, chemotaxis protein CheY